MRSLNLLVVFCGLMIGLIAPQFFMFNWSWPIYFGCGIIFVGLFKFLKKELFLLLALLFLSIAFGVFRFQMIQPDFTENNIAKVAVFGKPDKGVQPLTVIGKINDEPDVRSDQVKLTIIAQSLVVENKCLFTDGLILVKTSWPNQYEYGEKIKMTCVLQRPDKIEDFAYDEYLATSGIYTVCWRPKIEKLKMEKEVGVIGKILLFKNALSIKAQEILPEPASSLLAGLLWGAKKGLPKDVSLNFQKTGLSHLVAVSGYNVSILASFFTLLLGSIGLSKKWIFICLTASLFCFVILTGAAASIIRAALMGLAASAAPLMGAKSSAGRILWLSGLLMLIWNPLLIKDLGFQLSFLATAGLIYLQPLLVIKSWKETKLNFLSESLSCTMSALIITLPLTICRFGRLPVIAPLSNLLILPAVPFNMASGALALLVGFIYQPLGELVGWFAWIGLTYVHLLAEILAKISAPIYFELNLSSFMAIVFYVFLTLLLTIIRKSIKKDV
jgi:competence protein ComEC